MKFLDEYRNADIARRLLAEIGREVRGQWVLMEICGGQTHTIMRYGLDELLPANIELVHGPGCPVCVTPLETIDKALELAARPEVILVSYGDMLRVPGSRTDLFTVKAQGGDVRIAYSPTEALKIARQNPDRKVVFLAVGFETTAPANAMAIWQAKKEKIGNFSAARVARAGAARDSRADDFARLPRQRLHRARPRLHRDGLRRIRNAGARFPRSDCRGRL